LHLDSLKPAAIWFTLEHLHELKKMQEINMDSLFHDQPVVILESWNARVLESSSGHLYCGEN